MIFISDISHILIVNFDHIQYSIVFILSFLIVFIPKVLPFEEG